MLQFSFVVDTSCQNPSCCRLVPMHPDFFTPVLTRRGRFLFCFDCIERAKAAASQMDDEEAA